MKKKGGRFLIKHIFCDLDGTLLKDFRKIEEDDILALQLAERKGLKVSIATGRLDYEIKLIMEKYNFSGYRISQNGAVVFDDKSNLIYEESLCTKDTLLILEAIKGENVLVFFQTPDSYIVEKKIPIIEEFEKSQDFIRYIENTNILNELNSHDIVTISLWAEKDYNIKLKEKLNHILPNNISSIVSSVYTLDITCSINSKGNAIKHLIEKMNININEIAVIGDSYNDISMFDLTNFSFVMKDSSDDIKKHAKEQINSVNEAVFRLIK